MARDREESMIFQQLMMENQYHSMANSGNPTSYGGKMVGGEAGWSQPVQIANAGSDVYDGNMMTGFEEDEDSPCTIYYSRGYQGSHYM